MFLTSSHIEELLAGKEAIRIPATRDGALCVTVSTLVDNFIRTVADTFQ